MKNATPKQAAFLSAYAELGNVTAAAAAANIARSSHHNWMDDPKYAEAFAEAHEEACDRLETEARRRAIEGVEEPVIHKGELCYVTDRQSRQKRVLTVKKLSDTLLIFLLKGARPDKYRDNSKIEHSGAVNGFIRTKVDLSNLTDEQLSTLESIARAATGPSGDRSREDTPVTPEDGPLLRVGGTVPEGAVPEAP